VNQKRQNTSSQAFDEDFSAVLLQEKGPSVIDCNQTRPVNKQLIFPFTRAF